MRWPEPFAAAPQVVARVSQESHADEAAAAAALDVRAAPSPARLPLPRPARSRAGAAPSYAALPLGPNILHTERWHAAGREQRPAAPPPPPPPPPLPRPAPANLEDNPLTPDEAEYLLRLLLGDNFEAATAQVSRRSPGICAIAPPASANQQPHRPHPPPPPAVQLPKRGKGAAKPERGNAWRRGDALTALVTLFYEIDPGEGRVGAVTSHWDGVGGPFADPRDAYDVYLAVTGLLEWEPPGGEG
jgi:hypothetical protein